ncbi:hypothetical protein BDZ94DRAFT_972956 [Collybia nuda]|uniref:DUF6533 domain-containing protein n=1 Tax=Collybia nuda TaxID=64659 RepID=A0A9P5YEZ1_9AGAR|nr:hypothetical protein BDZ94DRAFT_972956 [Collybia nuda]
MSTPHPDTLTASTMYALRCAAYSALAFHIWEWMIGFPFEITYIWRKPRSSAVKWQYFGSRYIGIAAQIGNTIVSEYIHSSYERITWHFCLRLHIQQLIVCQWLLFSLEYSLIQRLIALSGRDAVLKFSLCVLVLAEHITLMAASVTMFRRAELIGACLAHRPCIEVAVNAWKKKVPLTSLVMRDGSWVFGVVSGAPLIFSHRNVAQASTHSRLLLLL